MALGVSLGHRPRVRCAAGAQARRLDAAGRAPGRGRPRRHQPAATARAIRSSLVVAEVALAVVLLTGAGLLIRSFWNLTRTDPGFRRHRRAEGGVPVPAGRYPVATRRARTSWHTTVSPSAAGAGRAAFPAWTRRPWLPITRWTPASRTRSASSGREAEAEDWPELSVRHVTARLFPNAAGAAGRGTVVQRRRHVVVRPRRSSDQPGHGAAGSLAHAIRWGRRSGSGANSGRS